MTRDRNDGFGFSYLEFDIGGGVNNGKGGGFDRVQRGDRKSNRVLTTN